MQNSLKIFQRKPIFINFDLLERMNYFLEDLLSVFIININKTFLLLVLMLNISILNLYLMSDYKPKNLWTFQDLQYK